MRATVGLGDFLQRDGEGYLQLELDLVERSHVIIKGNLIPSLPKSMDDRDKNCSHVPNPTCVVSSCKSQPN